MSHPIHFVSAALGAGMMVLAGALLGCDGRTAAGVAGGAAIGAGGAGAAYEYQNRKALEELEEDLAEGRISEREYLERKKEIEDRSIVY